ncbi:MAG: DUF3189 family protein [Gracilibacteraceae bacterium]|nr:DUF3189 family protein [Gracilibacteraceae bacterium]
MLWSTHSSILASAIHLKRIPADRIPTRQEILNLEYFNKLTYKDMGHLLFHGRDEYGNQVYSVGRGISKALIPAMRNPAITLCRNSPFDERFLFINCSSTVPPLMTLGGFFSRGLHLDFIGVPLLTAGVHQTYYNITKLIEKSKEICLEYSKEYLVIDIDEKGRLSVYN